MDILIRCIIIIDNRVTKIDDWYYIITPVMVSGYDSPVGAGPLQRILKATNVLTSLQHRKIEGLLCFQKNKWKIL